MFGKLIAALARTLEKTGIPYMIIGGQAVLIHGEPRFTRDIDVTLGVGPDSLQDLISAIKPLGWVALPQEPETFVAQTMVLPCEDTGTGIRIDFIFGLTAYEQESIQRAKPVQIEGAAVLFAGAEDLIIHKMIAGRPRDLEDVAGIVAKNPSMDLNRIRTTLKDFEEALEQPLLAEFERIWLKKDK
jgi:predicted nucleotidyltransferase